MENKKEEITKQNIFNYYNLKRCESVLFRNSAIIKTHSREYAQDMRECLLLLFKKYKSEGETREVVQGFLIYEQLLAELGGFVELTDESEHKKVMSEYQARRKCHVSYAPLAKVKKGA